MDKINENSRIIENSGLCISLSAPHHSTEVEHALRITGLHLCAETSTNDIWSANITKTGNAENNWNHGDIIPHQEGFHVKQTENGLNIYASTSHGLANGLYEFRHGLLQSGIEGFRKMPEGFHKPAFEQRDFYHFMTSWKLYNLTCDTFTMEQWKIHLERMRALNANRVFVDIWADSYYHPDLPASYQNRVLYDRLREVFAFAKELGLQTGVYLFPAQVPVQT
ncbi:MAG: hypothetical protein NT118_14820, partial [Lentisphaerae bacterium]|nr:hypothetical protein [Lentisphaerota bacterium]